MTTNATILNRTQEQHLKQCRKLYEAIGTTAVYEYANSIGVAYTYCKACESDTPELLNECAICGTKKQPMTTTEKNILIAEFIGYDGYMYPRELKYHTSWDWLMPVVEKIESLGFKSCIENHFCSFDGNSEETDGIWFENTNPPISKIDAVIQAVILFIQWYNNQSK